MNLLLRCIGIKNGTNNWANSTLNIYLNNDYYVGLTNSAKNMIDNVKYYLGGYNDVSITKEEVYNYERKIIGNDYFYGANESNIISKIGILYLSDYGYGANSSCSRVLTNYHDEICTDNNWSYLFI